MLLSEQDYKKLQSVVVFKNISSDVFEHTFAWGDAPPIQHTFSPGESRHLPSPIAEHLAKHLAMKILRGNATTKELKNGRTIVTPEKINELKQKILGDISNAPAEKPKSTNEVIQEHIDNLNPEDKAVVAPEGSKVATKADIIAELEQRGVKYNARATKAELKEELDALRLADTME